MHGRRISRGGARPGHQRDFYGTTALGGIDNDGAAFRLSAGLGAFVRTQTAPGKVGVGVTILGNRTGAASLSFNGTAAAFTVNSTGTAISTTVPAGATTGKVRVVTSGGTVSNNVPFRVA